MTDWKVFLTRKGISLQDYVDDHRISDITNLRRSFSKINLTVPLDKDPAIGDILWYTQPGTPEPDIKVVKLSKR